MVLFAQGKKVSGLIIKSTENNLKHKLPYTEVLSHLAPILATVNKFPSVTRRLQIQKHDLQLSRFTLKKGQRISNRQASCDQTQNSDQVGR